MKGEAFNQKDKFEKSAARRHSRGGLRGRGQGRGWLDGQLEQRQSFNEQKNYKTGVQCYCCKSFGHRSKLLEQKIASKL